jgi:RHS repeat-associated protein
MAQPRYKPSATLGRAKTTSRGWTERTGIVCRFRFPDWQGTIRAESNSATRVFTESLAFAPFGERYAVKGAPINVDSFTGKPDQLVSDEYDFPARQEHNGQGRWISPDPMRGTGNKYVYAGNNPLSNVDLQGLLSITIDGGPELAGQFRNC